MRRLLLSLAGLLLFLRLPAQTPNFTASVTSGCAPLSVSFTPNAPGAVSYQWNLGTGGTSVLSNPGVIYAQGGTYSVSMTAFYPNGTSATVTKSNLVTAFSPPSVQFSANFPSACTGTPITFTNQATPGSSPVVSFAWDFGDGGVSTQPSPVYTYPQTGQYTVTLAVEDANGCKASLTRPYYIQINTQPDPGFSANSQFFCNAPAVVTLYPNAQTPGMTHSWSISNGPTSSLPSPTLILTANGSYTVSHMVSDPSGCNATQTNNGFLYVGVPAITLQASKDTVCAGSSISFSTGVGGSNPVTWNFGPGNGTSTVQMPTVPFNVPGQFVVTASTSIAGCPVTGTVPVVVNPMPTAGFTLSDTVLCNPPYTLTCTNTSAGASVFAWNLNGAPSPPGTAPATFTTQNVTYTYPKAGTYTLYLKATTALGCSDDTLMPASVVAGPTTARAQRFPQSGCAPLSVDFTDLSTSPSPILSWHWDFGDGNTSTQQHPTHVYQNPGTFTVTLIVTTLHGCNDTLIWPAMVKAGVKPVADFVADTLIACASRAIVFTNLSLPAPDSSNWYFGDGGSSTAIHPSYYYQDTGAMEVTLIAFDRGCPDTLIRPAYLYINAPIAKFEPDIDFSCTYPVTVSFLDTSIVPHRWSWNFGTGMIADTSNLQHPSFTFTQEGNYVVRLKVYNDSTGCSHTTTKVFQVQTITAAFSTNKVSGCAPLGVAFTDQSVNPALWQWTFGNGTQTSSTSPMGLFPLAGIYHPRLIATNSLGCSDTAETEIKVYQPDVNFSLADTAMCAPASPVFTNLTTSMAPVTSWLWQVGFGATSTLATPTFTIPTMGVYTVSLKAVDSLGCVGMKTRSAYLKVLDPVANFTTQYPVNCPGNSLLFNNLSQGSGLQYAWTFGEGASSSAYQPYKVYSTPGLYTVTLAVADQEGCKDTLVKPAYIQIATPQVDFSATPNGASCPPLLSAFTFQPVSPHAFNTFQWSFGSGTNSVQQNPSHLYTQPGSYTVTLIASAASGCRDTLVKPNYISIGGPSGTFSFSPATVCPFDTVFLTATSPNAVTYEFDMNDGTLAIGNPTTHQYIAAGTYSPQMLITDAAGCKIAVAGDSITVHPAPVAAFTVSNDLLCDSGMVTFTSTSTSAGTIASTVWYFPNQFPASGPTATQVYHAPGDGAVKLVVTNGFGCKNTLEDPFSVLIAQSPEAHILTNQADGCVPFSPVLRDSVVAPNTLASAQWGLIAPWGAVSPFANPPGPTIAQSGTFQAQLIVIDGYGCKDTAWLPLIAHPLPVPDFFVPQQLGCAPFVAPFQNATYSDPPTLFAWQFGDAAISTDSMPVHIYAENGQYTVSLTATNRFGCVDSVVKPAYIDLALPTVSFVADTQQVCPGTPVVFTATASAHAPISSYTWNFGDGTLLAGPATIAHGYSQPGAYTVSVTVADVLGCEQNDTLSQQIEVLRDESPEATQIRRVTVLDDATIRVEWNRYRGDTALFNAYRLLREDPAGNVVVAFSSGNKDDTVLIDRGIQPVSQAYCYTLTVVNSCGRQSPQTDVHCSVETRAVALPDVNLVSWSPYVGWPVDRYEVFRVKNYADPGELLAELPGTTHDFVDTTIYCNTVVSYRISATGKEAWHRSQSDTARVQAIHSPPALAANVLNGTILDNADAGVLWQLPYVRAAQQVTLTRLERGQATAQTDWRWAPQAVPTPPWRDASIHAQQDWYTYHLQVVDTCGDATPPGTFGQTILLKARKSGASQATVSWNPYTGWPQGVERYVIERWVGNAGAYLPLITVSNSTITWTDTLDDDTDFVNCYRVRAFGQGDSLQESLSNEACITLESSLWPPNAFTPNGDTVNNTFYFPGKYIGMVEMRIFDRWGHKIYEEYSAKPAWTGREDDFLYPEGVYMYLLHGTGLDGKVFEYSGFVVLIR